MRPVVSEALHDLHRAIGVHGRRLDEAFRRLAELEARAKVVDEDAIKGAAALLMAEHRLQLDDLTDLIIENAGKSVAAKHAGTVQHIIVEAVRRGVRIGKGEMSC